MKEDLLKKIQETFKMELPISDNGEFWDGKPKYFSNFKRFDLHYTQKFAMNLLDYSQFGIDGHNGIDIGGALNAPISAPIRIYVTYTRETDNGYGLVVFAETEEKEIDGKTIKLEMVFGHFNEVVAKPYKWYNVGELIGRMGTTGFSTGVHLHFGIRPWIKQDGGGWVQMEKDNGYRGYIDPEFFMPHMVWDIRELINENKKDMEIKTFIEKNDLKWVRNGDTGEFGRVMQKELKVIKTKDRGVLILLDDKIRESGVTIDNNLWKSLPKSEF